MNLSATCCKSSCSTELLRMISLRANCLFLSALVYQIHRTQVIFSHSLLEVYITLHFISEEEVSNPPFVQSKRPLGKESGRALYSNMEIYVHF